MAMTTMARPSELNPEHLWLADDEDKLVVSVLAPEVAGDARHDTSGPVTVVSPYPVSRPGGMYATRPAEVGLHTPRSGAARIGWAGTASSAAVAAACVWSVGLWAGVAVTAAGLGVTLWQALRRYTRVAHQWTEGHLVLTHYDDRAVVQDAAKNVRYTATVWPQLHVHVELDDPAPMLARRLWDLALLVGQRAATRELRQQLVAAGRGVPDGTRTAAELAKRIVRTDNDLVQLNADIDRRRANLWRLANEVSEFVTEQQALARANAMIRDVDRRHSLPPPAATDTAGELAEHTTAVLAAYRELTRLGPSLQ
jgi:hypothetical protein